jgi:3-methyladenine DNA glycosylase AlkD
MPEIETLLAELPTTPTTEAVLEMVTRAFEALADRGAYAQAMQSVIPGVDKMYAVRVPLLRKLAKGIQKAYKQDRAVLKEIALASWKQASREHELLALFLLGYITNMSPAERWELGNRFLPKVRHWEACDQLCAALLGEALAQDARYIDELERWVKNKELWVRRAALVATVYLRRARHPHETALDLDRRTLGMCASLLDDKQPYIRKAVDWAIRETIKRRYDLGYEWMMAQASVKTSPTARSTLKLASKKLHDSDRKTFLSSLGD